ncbi:MAG: hypothetical protein ABSG39_11195 [Acidimicrobiales bacterium]
MSYSDLLAEAMKVPRAAGPSDGLLEALVKSRHARALGERSSGQDVPGRLASEVAYDRALIDISDAMGIETSPGHFVSPMTERQRPEHVLAERGSNWSRFIYPHGATDHRGALASAA